MTGLYRITNPAIQARLEKEFHKLGLDCVADTRDNGVWLSVKGTPNYKPSNIILPPGIKVPGCKNWLRRKSKISRYPKPNSEPRLFDVFDAMDERYRLYRKSLLI